ncbi:hypothetical protein [Bacillus proteolyticus]|uniref:hypothetical protein n=1 Tax=Bacillus proteolyticus TaxID=2026192 RepID=UPI003D049E74
MFGYKDGEKKSFPITFKTLKQVRTFTYKHALENPGWLNANGDISEYNVKVDRDEHKNVWQDNVIENVYKNYTDFNNW